MQIGDPKKTAMLGVVAIGALIFLGSRVMGLKGEEAPKATRQANAADAGATKLAITSVDQLRNDPFSHPKLAPHFPNGGQPPVNSGTGAGPITTPPTGGDAGPLLDPNSPGMTISKVPPDDWPTPQNPDKHTGKDPRPQPVEKMTTVVLKAIFKVGERTAYLSIAGSEPRPFRMGDLIKDDLIVVSVNDDSVILKTTKRTLTLRVGQQGDL